MSIEIDGLEELRKKMAASAPRAAKDLGRGLFTEGNKIMTTSKQSFVPVDQGVLRASGHVKPPVVSRTGASVNLGYGGAASAYALVQHERTDYAHTVGQAKYLEIPVRQAAAGFGERVARELDVWG